MEVISSSSYPSGRLNPNAPMFVPVAYRAVEDFSEEWWALVHSCPWFRDYWLQERYLDTDDLLLLPDSLDAGADDDDDDVWCYSDYYCPHADVEIEENKSKELAKIGTMKWQNGRAFAQVPRYAEKAPKILKGKMSPRTIQQPK